MARGVSKLALAATILLSSLCALSVHAHKAPTYLYVWAGADPTIPSANDTLFVLDVRAGPSFAKVLKMVATPYKGMEPHHAGLSADGKTLGAGGLLSLLTPGLPGVVFFNVTDPAHPTLLPGVAQPALSAVPDDFLATPSGGFLVTMMGSASGGSPGRVAQYDRHLKLVAEHPTDLAQLGAFPGFNPHGIAADFAHGTMVTVDFIEPASTLNAVPGPVVARSTVRLWDLRTMTINKTFDAAGFGAAGMMDARLVHPHGVYYVTASDGVLYLLDARSGFFGPVFDLGAENKPAQHSLMHSFRRHTRLAVTAYGPSKVFLLDTTDPYHPVLLDEVFFGAGAGAHVIKVSADESLVAVVTYFLDEGSVGKVAAAGDKTLRLLSLDCEATHMTPHAAVPLVDFKTLVPGMGAFRPHAVIFSA